MARLNTKCVLLSVQASNFVWPIATPRGPLASIWTSYEVPFQELTEHHELVDFLGPRTYARKP